jgi:hypothetical protein
MKAPDRPHTSAGPRIHSYELEAAALRKRHCLRSTLAGESRCDMSVWAGEVEAEQDRAACVG